MLPDISGLRVSIDANTAIQREVLLMLQKMHAAIQEQNALLKSQAVDQQKGKQ